MLFRSVVKYALGCSKVLIDRGVKAIVVACNTVSAVALDLLAVELDIPVLGVIGPGAREGARRSKRGRIGVIATAGTVDSGAYPRAIASANTRAETCMAAAPLLVPLAEEGWTEGEVPGLVARRYLEPLLRAGIDTLVLGCTHYPLLRAEIVRQLQLLGSDTIPVVDSAEATAEELAELLDQRALRAQRPEGGALRMLVTDTPKRFSEVASRFLGRSVEGLPLQAIDL